MVITGKTSLESPTIWLAFLLLPHKSLKCPLLVSFLVHLGKFLKFCWYRLLSFHQYWCGCGWRYNFILPLPATWQKWISGWASMMQNWNLLRHTLKIDLKYRTTRKKCWGKSSIQGEPRESHPSDSGESSSYYLQRVAKKCRWNHRVIPDM